MTPLFKKLNYKSHPEILLLNAPESFLAERQAMSGEAHIYTNTEEVAQIGFALVFVQTPTQVEVAAQAIAPKLRPDAVWWFAYPKGTSKRYK